MSDDWRANPYVPPWANRFHRLIEPMWGLFFIGMGAQGLSRLDETTAASGGAAYWASRLAPTAMILIGVAFVAAIYARPLWVKRSLVFVMVGLAAAWAAALWVAAVHDGKSPSSWTHVINIAWACVATGLLVRLCGLIVSTFVRSRRDQKAGGRGSDASA